jgi:hypothetical protein
MVFEADGIKYRFFFRHIHALDQLREIHLQLKPGRKLSQKVIKQARDKTYCTVVTGPREAEVVMAEGISTRIPTDKYDAETGRVEAVRAAAAVLVDS